VIVLAEDQLYLSQFLHPSLFLGRNKQPKIRLSPSNSFKCSLFAIGHRKYQSSHSVSCQQTSSDRETSAAEISTRSPGDRYERLLLARVKRNRELPIKFTSWTVSFAHQEVILASDIEFFWSVIRILIEGLHADNFTH